ncbi:MAG: hypothetical protein ACOVSW_04265 [Candidatus Kapaibacteriota bacterium]
MLLNYYALAQALYIPNLNEHLRSSARRKPSSVICDVRPVLVLPFWSNKAPVLRIPRRNERKSRPYNRSF